MTTPQPPAARTDAAVTITAERLAEIRGLLYGNHGNNVWGVPSGELVNVAEELFEALLAEIDRGALARAVIAIADEIHDVWQYGIIDGGLDVWVRLADALDDYHAAATSADSGARNAG